jgi:CheY-like chemotaxis protein
VVNDVIAIIRMRLNEKPVRLVTRIDGSLPAALIGDEARVRQVLLNLLSNAVKYTREGSITLSIHKEDSPDGQENSAQGGEEPWIRIAFAIADTGIGIRKEDLEKLFGNFVQLDRERNRGVEGTGLGLAISRSLCLLMGGNITVESVYGQGSVFTAIIPQRVRDGSPFARVENPETKRALIYENRSDYVESVAYTLNNLGVNCASAQTREDFAEKLSEGGWKFIFASPSLTDEVQEALENCRFKPGEKPALALLTEYGQVARPDMLTLFMPLQPAAMANILNGNKISNTYHEIENPGIRFTAPDARILLVDDIETNLDVAEGLLSPYETMISRAVGGFEAVQMVKENFYDIVFMDHMMPGMDGIEAAAAIRKWEEANSREGTTLIALTANAISGMKEMFLEKGFNDYISKPIEIVKLDEIMSKWIPVGKRKKVGVSGTKRESFKGQTGIVIPGVDVAEGINMTGGSEEGYRKVLKQFCRDAADRLDWFRNLLPPAQIAPQAALVATQAHAIKSAAGTIGAREIASDAAALETAGKAGDAGSIGEVLPGFCRRLAELIKAAKKTLEEGEKKEGGLSEADETVLQGLSALREALVTKNMKEIDRILEELEKTGDAKTRERITAISDKVLMGEYTEAILAIGGEQLQLADSGC